MPRFSAGQSVANQIRTKHLGVMSGGTQGRAKFMHKGVGLNQNKGGMNVRGSMPGMRPRPWPNMKPPARPGIAPRPSEAGGINKGSAVRPRPIGVRNDKGPVTSKPSRPAFNKPQGGMRYVTRGGKRGAVRWDRLTADEQARFGNGPSPSAPVETTPAPTPQAALPDTLDYTGLSSYKDGMSDLDYELAGERAGLTRQLAENKVAYAREQGDLKRNYERDVESGEDSLSGGNLLRSGVRETADADRFREFDRYMGGLEQQYGSGATAKINEALAGLDRFEAESRRRIEEEARSQYGELYPAAPIAETFEEEVVDAPAAATPRGKAKAPAGMQFVKDPKRPGKYLLRPIPKKRRDPAFSVAPIPARTPFNTAPIRR